MITKNKYIKNIFTGKRKTSICRLYVYSNQELLSKSQFVNGLSVQKYFQSSLLFRVKSLESLKLCDYQLGFRALINGGGLSSQAKALQASLSRYLSRDHEQCEENKKILKKNNFLNMDFRPVERKKAGFTKARKGHQRSKR